MLKHNTDLIRDDDTRNAVEHILQEGMGKLIELEAAPTADAPLLSADEAGVYSDVLYVRKGETILVFTPSSTITIT